MAIFHAQCTRCDYEGDENEFYEVSNDDGTRERLCQECEDARLTYFYENYSMSDDDSEDWVEEE